MVIVSLLLCSASCVKEQRGAKKIQAVASITPLGDFVRQVGGDRVSVDVIVPPGSSPHTFEPTPTQIKSIHNADLMVVVGVNLEFWLSKVLEAAGNPHLTIVDLSDGIFIIREPHEHGERETGDPHIWLSPRNAIKHIEKIRDALIRLDPGGKDLYERNAGNYIKSLKDLDLQISESVKNFSSRKFISNHSAWVYFARDYGLEQVASIEPTPGREPSPAELEAIIKIARQYKVKAIFTERQFSTKAADALAGECHCRVVYLNPFGDPPDYNYISCMKSNLKMMEDTLR